MGVAMRNSQDAISMMQTADGALEELTNIAYRMKDLATQAANGTNGTSEIAALDAEYQELVSEGERILQNTTFGSGTKLLEGGSFDTAGGVTFQIGASTAETLNVDIQADITKMATFFDAAGSARANDLTDAAAANTTIDSVDTILSDVSAGRSKLGANINRLDHTINNLQSISENTAAAKGRITDADYAVESANMTKQQMLMQAGTQMLATSKQMPSMAMSLLG
jgi:flagellin